MRVERTIHSWVELRAHLVIGIPELGIPGSPWDVPESPALSILDTGGYRESVLASGRSCRCHCPSVQLGPENPECGIECSVPR